jgi:polysaccharide deacetylase family sporulation protein PdaB
MKFNSKKIIRFAIITSAFFVVSLLFKPSVQTVFKIAESNRLLPIYCVDRPDNKISISFDAAWDCKYTDKLLEILRNNNVKATFFLCGYWLNDYPDKVKEIAAEGHDIGNHGNKHAHGAQLSLEENKQEILKANEKIKQITGKDAFLFRPPYGEYNNTVIKAAQELNYYPIQWTIDSLDWKELGSEHEIDRVLNHKALGSGAIILFHNDAKYTPQVLDQIIKSLKEKGYELVPISQLIYKDNYHINSEGRQILNKQS